MKDFIVMIAMIVLGVFIAALILGTGGDDSNSLKGASKGLMQNQINQLTDVVNP